MEVLRCNTLCNFVQNLIRIHTLSTHVLFLIIHNQHYPNWGFRQEGMWHQFGLQVGITDFCPSCRCTWKHFPFFFFGVWAKIVTPNTKPWLQNAFLWDEWAVLGVSIILPCPPGNRFPLWRRFPHEGQIESGGQWDTGPAAANRQQGQRHKIAHT